MIIRVIRGYKSSRTFVDEMDDFLRKDWPPYRINHDNVLERVEG